MLKVVNDEALPAPHTGIDNKEHLLMVEPLVSVIVPTKNSARFLSTCLESITSQSYPLIELIVVDNGSTDATRVIAHRYTDNVYTWGPERSAQVNYGVERAKGRYVYKVDSDFVLERDVVAQCVSAATAGGFDAIVVHNSPDSRVSWIATIRKFEVDMYKYDLTHSSARFVDREVYQAIGGFDPRITAGEDYDFQNKLNRGGYRTGFVAAEAIHLGEPTRFWRHMRKYYDYGRDFVHYQAANRRESGKQLTLARVAYIRQWRRFTRHPVLGMAFIMYSLCKFACGGAGFLVGKASLRCSTR